MGAIQGLETIPAEIQRGFGPEIRRLLQSVDIEDALTLAEKTEI